MATQTWRVLHVSNPNNHVEVRAEAEKQIKTLLDLYSLNATFDDVTHVDNGLCWGPFYCF